MASSGSMGVPCCVSRFTAADMMTIGDTGPHGESDASETRAPASIMLRIGNTFRWSCPSWRTPVKTSPQSQASPRVADEVDVEVGDPLGVAGLSDEGMLHPQHRPGTGAAPYLLVGVEAGADRATAHGVDGSGDPEISGAHGELDDLFSRVERRPDVGDTAIVHLVDRGSVREEPVDEEFDRTAPPEAVVATGQDTIEDVAPTKIGRTVEQVPAVVLLHRERQCSAGRGSPIQLGHLRRDKRVPRLL